MLSEDSKPFEERIDSETLENIIKSSLSKNGINTDFNFQLINHSFFGSKIIQKNTDLINQKNAYHGHILPGLMGRGKHEIILNFPNNHFFIAKKVWLMLISSMLLIIILIYAFYYSIQSLIKQRKIAELKNDFISNMTHELKTPITSINLACETISDDNFNFNKESVNNYLNIISDENKRLKTLVNNVLDSSFIDSEELKLSKIDVDLVDLTKQVSKRFKVLLESRNGKINITSNVDPIITKGDKFHLSNTIYNLIDNAIKYTEVNPEINIDIQLKDSKIIIKIKDNGIGIAKANHSKIFDKFHRVSRGNIHNVKGFGLGLNYVKRMVELHNGQIYVDSELGKGSTFRIVL